MTDIVERLKSGDFYQREGFDAAAAEITALREKLERVERERDALQARVERLEKALRAWIDATRMVVIDSRVRAEARAALAADGENNDRD